MMATLNPCNKDTGKYTGVQRKKGYYNSQ